MANIPFFTYPSFANVSRYEHSLGVAHLAWRWAQRNSLPEDMGVALTLAALYHDGATPAYGHLFEEFLTRHGFDHERALVELLLGEPVNIPGRQYAQVFLGGECKLRSALPDPTDADSYLTTFKIADIVAGKPPLGRLISGDIDLDNIDNVIRAVTAMGLVTQRSLVHPYEVADALVLEDEEVRVTKGGRNALLQWAGMRRILYDSIINNAHEFRAQAAVKWAIEECANDDAAVSESSAWKLTEPVLTFEHLRKHKHARLLVDRVRAAKPPELLFSCWLDDLSPLLGPGSKAVIRALCDRLSAASNMLVYVNFYVDKRERPIHLPWSRRLDLFQDKEPIADHVQSTATAPPAGILGAVVISPLEYGPPDFAETEQMKLKGRRRVGEGELRDILSEVLEQEPVAMSTGWLGTSVRSGQARLFGLSEWDVSPF